MYKVHRFLCTSLAPDKYSYKHTQKETKASPLQVLCKEYIINFNRYLPLKTHFPINSQTSDIESASQSEKLSETDPKGNYS